MNGLLFPSAILIITSISSSSFALATGLDGKPHFYGRIHIALVSEKDKDLNVNNEGHILGFKGTLAVTENQTAFYRVEAEYRNDDETDYDDAAPIDPSATSSKDTARLAVRQAHVGIRDSFGTVIMGRQNNPLRKTYKADKFYRNSGWAQQNSTRIGDAISYSLELENISLVAAVVADGTDSENPRRSQEYFDAYIAVAELKYSGVSLAIGHMSTQYERCGEKSYETIVGVSYRKSKVYIGLQLESGDERYFITDSNVQVNSDPCIVGYGISDRSFKIADLYLKYKIDKMSYTFGSGVRDESLSMGGGNHKCRSIFEGVYSFGEKFVGYVGY